MTASECEPATSTLALSKVPIKAKYEIVSDPKGMEITVGPRVFKSPDLIRRPEFFFDLKESICPPPEGPRELKQLHLYYAPLLGCKFNRRFQAANYWLWIGNRMTSQTANMLRHEGKHWKNYSSNLVERANAVLPYINEAERDGLLNLIPMIVAFGAPPQAVRQLIGRGAWRRVANNSMTRNRLIMNALDRTKRAGQEKEETLGRLLEIPSGVMRFLMAADDDEIIAARVAPRKRRDEYLQAHHLVRDTRYMTGMAFSPNWSYARIVEEHGRATKALMRGKYSAKPFAPEWSMEADGFSATLLVSPLEIATEGATQHHCVASYARRAAGGSYVLLRIEGKERATAGAVVGRDVVLDQVYAACNGAVSSDCQAFARTALKRYAEYRAMLTAEARAA